MCPPTAGPGLYKELVTLRDLISEYREDPDKNAVLKEAILKTIIDSGLYEDCPFEAARGMEFTLENARLFSTHVFNRYLVDLYEYLQVLENRLFSSGLHVLGQPPSAEQLQSYLSAYFGDELKPELVEEIGDLKGVSVDHPPPMSASTSPGSDPTSLDRTARLNTQMSTLAISSPEPTATIW
jgi:magnesium chelatase subunit H